MKKKILCFALSAMMALTLIPQISFCAEEQNVYVITDFDALETSEYCFKEELSEEEIAEELPDTINVHIDGSNESEPIDVTWKALENYDNSDFYFYSMKPVWDDRNYTLSEELDENADVPWITIYKETGRITRKLMKSAESSDSVSAYATDNQKAIYNYLTGTLGYSTAAACGVMTNIYAESGLQSNNLQNTYNSRFGLSDAEYTKAVNNGSNGNYKTSGGTSMNFKTDSAGYGLCQWTSSGRKTNLYNYAKDKMSSFDISGRNMQMTFLNKELTENYPTVYATVTKASNNAAGAYANAAMFCLAYEVPANTISTAASRAKNCMSGYWKTYSGSAAPTSGVSYLSLCGYAYPKAIKKGKGITVNGYAVSNYRITKLKGIISRSNGTAVYSKTIKPNTTACSLYKLDEAMKFGSLAAGTYTYTVYAKDKFGSTVKAKHTFKVTANGTTGKLYGFKSTASSDPEKKGYTGKFPTLPKRGYFKKGDKGTQVKYLQKFLKWAGYNITTGGTYGSKTVSAVKKFQKDYGLTCDGKFGKACLAKAKTIKK